MYGFGYYKGVTKAGAWEKVYLEVFGFNFAVAQVAVLRVYGEPGGTRR